VEQIKEAFESDFGIALPDAMLPSGPVVPFGDSRHLVGSPSAIDSPFFIQRHIQDFIDSAPDDYYTIGYWGYGIASHAFYYVRVSGPIRVFFRLPHGNAYEEPAEEAALIREFLPRYLAFEERLTHCGVKSLVAIESMGSATYLIARSRGERLELPEIEPQESPFYHPHLLDLYLEVLGI
jgi:hypothetical protein